MIPSPLSVLELQSRLDREPASVVIDVRTPVEFAGVHAKQAINVPLDRICAAALAQVGCSQREQPVYLLCHSGQRAAKAAAKLSAEGFTQAIIVSGGTQAWIQAGLPVVRGTSTVISLERQVRIAAGGLVLGSVLLAQFVHPSFIGLAGFVGAGLIFAGVTDFCGMGLLLAKLPWNQRTN